MRSFDVMIFNRENYVSKHVVLAEQSEKKYVIHLKLVMITCISERVLS